MPRTPHEEFNAIKSEALGVVNAARLAGRDLTAEETEANKRRFSDMDRIKASILEEQRFAAAKLPDVIAEALAAATSNPATQTAVQQFAGKSDSEKFAAARGEINQFIREGQNGQKFALISTTGSSVMLPSIPAQPVPIRRIANPIIAAILSQGLAPLYTAGTETIPVPVFDDTANDATEGTGAGVEDATTESNQDPTTTGLTLGAKLYDSKAIWLSNTLLNATGYDLLGYCEPILQKRVDHKQQSSWMGNIATNATVGKTTASKAAITYSELLAWEHSVPIAYRSDLCYIFTDSLLQTVRGIVDSQGRPLYQESLRDDTPDKFFGKPLFLTDATTGGLGTLTTANAIVGAACSAEALKARLCTNRRLARYVSVPGHPDQLGLELFVNGDFTFVPNGVRTLKLAAT